MSVVIPAHDAAATLAAALASLEAQTRRDWEALVVDDGSTDGTRAIAEGHAARDRRIRVLTGGPPGRPLGVSAARNLGIAEAAGCFLLFLDADDWIAPTALARLAGALERHDEARIAYGGWRRVTPRGRKGDAMSNPGPASRPSTHFTGAYDLPIHSMMFARRDVMATGGFDTSLATCEDWDLVQRLARRGARFVRIRQTVAFYRMASGSLSTDVAAVLRDGQAVIRRGFGLDQLSNGARAQRSTDQLMASGLYALWCAAFETGRGGDGRAMVAPLPVDHDGLIEACRGAILDGLGCGAQRLPGELAHDGLQAAGRARVARLKDLLESLETANRLPGLARTLAWALAPDLSDAGGDTDPVAIGRTLYVRQQATRMHAVVADPEIKWVHLEVRHGGRVVARVDLPRATAGRLADIAEAVLQATGLRAFLSIHGLWRRPGFWLHAARAAAARTMTALLQMRLVSPKTVARETITEAALASVAGQRREK